MCKILIVEDEEILSEGLCKALADVGYVNTKKITNGISALDYIASNHVDIVISDIRMPLMDGLTLIKQISENYPDIECIILSGYGEFEYAREAMKYNVHHYLLKPYNRKELIEAIDEIKTKRTNKKEHTDERSIEIESDNKWIVEMVNYVHKNLSDSELSLKKIAKEVLFVNEGYLSRLFNKEMGVSFPKYVTRMRIELAKELIEKNSNMRIYEISMRTGFGPDARYFSQVFKYYTGSNPKEYMTKL